MSQNPHSHSTNSLPQQQHSHQEQVEFNRNQPSCSGNSQQILNSQNSNSIQGNSNSEGVLRREVDSEQQESASREQQKFELSSSIVQQLRNGCQSSQSQSFNHLEFAKVVEKIRKDQNMASHFKNDQGVLSLFLNTSDFKMRFKNEKTFIDYLDLLKQPYSQTKIKQHCCDDFELYALGKHVNISKGLSMQLDEIKNIINSKFKPRTVGINLPLYQSDIISLLINQGNSAHPVIYTPKNQKNDLLLPKEDQVCHQCMTPIKNSRFSLICAHNYFPNNNLKKLPLSEQRKRRCLKIYCKDCLDEHFGEEEYLYGYLNLHYICRCCRGECQHGAVCYQKSQLQANPKFLDGKQLYIWMTLKQKRERFYRGRVVKLNENTRAHVIELKNKILAEKDLTNMKWFYAKQSEDIYQRRTDQIEDIEMESYRIIQSVSQSMNEEVEQQQHQQQQQQQLKHKIVESQGFQIEYPDKNRKKATKPSKRKSSDYHDPQQIRTSDRIKMINYQKIKKNESEYLQQPLANQRYIKKQQQFQEQLMEQDNQGVYPTKYYSSQMEQQQLEEEEEQQEQQQNNIKKKRKYVLKNPPQQLKSKNKQQLQKSDDGYQLTQTKQIKDEIKSYKKAISLSPPSQLIGTRVAIFWQHYNLWFLGIVREYYRKSKEHQILYDDNLADRVNLKSLTILSECEFLQFREKEAKQKRRKMDQMQKQQQLQQQQLYSYEQQQQYQEDEDDDEDLQSLNRSHNHQQSMYMNYQSQRGSYGQSSLKKRGSQHMHRSSNPHQSLDPYKSHKRYKTKSSNGGGHYIKYQTPPEQDYRVHRRHPYYHKRTSSIDEQEQEQEQDEEEQYDEQGNIINDIYQSSYLQEDEDHQHLKNVEYQQEGSCTIQGFEFHAVSEHKITSKLQNELYRKKQLERLSNEQRYIHEKQGGSGAIYLKQQMSNENIRMTSSDINAINQHLFQNLPSSQKVKDKQPIREESKYQQDDEEEEKNKGNSSSQSRGKIIITHQNQKQPQVADQKSDAMEYQINPPRFEGNQHHRFVENSPPVYYPPPYGTHQKNMHGIPAHLHAPPPPHYPPPPPHTSQRFKQYSPMRPDFKNPNYHFPYPPPQQPNQNFIQNHKINNPDPKFLQYSQQQPFYNPQHMHMPHQFRKGVPMRGPPLPPPPHPPPYAHQENKINPLVYQNNSTMKGSNGGQQHQEQWQDFLNSNGFDSQSNLIRQKACKIQDAQRIFLKKLPQKATLKQNKSNQQDFSQQSSINVKQQRSRDQNNETPIQGQEQLMSLMDEEMKEEHNLYKANLQDIAHLLTIKLEKYYHFQFQQFKVKKCECCACKHLVLPFLIEEKTNPDEYLLEHYDYLRNFVSQHFDEESCKQTLKRIFKEKYEEYNQKVIDAKKEVNLQKGEVNEEEREEEEGEGEEDEEEGEEDKEKNDKNLKKKKVLIRSYKNIDNTTIASKEENNPVIQGQMVCNYLMRATSQ